MLEELSAAHACVVPHYGHCVMIGQAGIGGSVKRDFLLDG